ncbi:MAG: FAD-dependent oxidoreductase [Patescibacteria group bacterium]
MHDLIIIGGGPAAIGAGIYAARKKLKTLLITESVGGQSVVSDKIENWIGEIEISGFELAEKLEKHLRANDSTEIKTGERVSEVVSDDDDNFTVKLQSGIIFQSRAVIVASGGRRRRLDIPGENEFDGKGVAFCTTCDAPLFGGKDVAVVGGGNSALESVVDLFAYANKIYLIVRGDELKGDPITQEKIKQDSKVEIIFNAEPKEILGDKFVTGLKYENKKNNETKVLQVEGVFVEIGSVPNSEMAKNLVDINTLGEIIVDHKTAATSHQGIFAAGDVSDEIYKQNNISVGDGIRAALSAYNYILKIKKEAPAPI